MFFFKYGLSDPDFDQKFHGKFISNFEVKKESGRLYVIFFLNMASDPYFSWEFYEEFLGSNFGAKQ